MKYAVVTEARELVPFGITPYVEHERTSFRFRWLAWLYNLASPRGLIWIGGVRYLVRSRIVEVIP